MAALFEAVREACARTVWSRGGELARGGAVRRDDAQAPGELVLRVVEKGRVVAPRVVLYPDPGEWECDCASRDDPCVHVAAAAIALKNDLVRELEARLGYRFRRAEGALQFERAAVTASGEEPFRGTLAAQAAGAAPGPRVAASDADFEIERLLGAQRAGRLPRGVLHKLVAALEGSADLRLDGEPLHASAAPCAWRARVRDDGPGFRLDLERHPPVTEELGDGVVRCGDTLRVLAASGLEGREIEAFARGRRFAPDEAAALAAELLPGLRRRIEVVVETTRLPEARSEPPRLVVETRREEDGLSVLATLVYGDPPRARVDAGRLVPLQGALPVRDAEAEARLTAHLRAALGLEPGVRLRLEPGEALGFVARLEGFRGSVEGRGHEAFFRAGPLIPHFAGGADDLALELRTDAGERVDAARAVAAWRAGESLVPLAGGGFAELPADLLDAPRRAGRRSPRRARRRGREAPRGVAPRPRAPLRGARRAAAPGPRAPPSADRGLRRHPRRDPPRGSPRRAARLPAPRRRLAALPRATPGSARSSPTTWGSGRPSRRSARSAAAPSSSRRRACSAAGPRRPSASAPALRRCLFHGPGRSLDPEADVTFTSYALLRLERERLAAVAWDGVDPRRGPGDQEPGQPVGRGGARAARAGARGAQRDARREPPGGALEPVPVPEPGAPRRAARTSRRALARPIAAGDAGGGRAPAPAHPALRAAAPEGRGRPRAAAAPGADRARRPLRRGARRLRRGARGDACPRSWRSSARAAA